MLPPRYLPVPRDIVRVPASVDKTLHSFFFDNSRLSSVSLNAKSNKLSTPAPHASSPSVHKQAKSGPPRPGVILDVSSDCATVAMFTSLRGKGLIEVKGLLRPIMAQILPVNHKPNDKTSVWLPTLAIHPTWGATAAAKHSLCLCLKHQVPIDELEPWTWKDEPVTVEQRYRMCRPDFGLLKQLCERNEGLRGLLTSPEMRWFFEELFLEDFLKRCD